MSSGIEGEDGSTEKCSRGYGDAPCTAIAVGGDGALGDGESAAWRDYVVPGRMFFILKDVDVNCSNVHKQSRSSLECGIL